MFRNFINSANIILCLVALCLCSCLEMDETEDNSCGITDVISNYNTSMLVPMGNKIAQNISYQSPFTLVSAKFYMSSNNLTTATLKIYEGNGYPSTGTLVGTSSHTSTLGSSSATDTVTFYFSSPVSIWSNIDYNFVIEGNGSFEISYYQPGAGSYFYTQAGIDHYNSGTSTWSTYSQYGHLASEYNLTCN